MTAVVITFYGFLPSRQYKQTTKMIVDKISEHQIVPGISVSPTGQATVDPAVSNLLFDLAIELEEPLDLPVDVEHVLAAIVLAVRTGELDPNVPLSSDDPVLVEVLTRHVKAVFEQYGGSLGTDD